MYRFAIKPSAVTSSAITLYGLPASSRIAPTPSVHLGKLTLRAGIFRRDADQEANHAVRSDDGVEGRADFAAAIRVQHGILRQQGGELGRVAGGAGGEEFAQYRRLAITVYGEARPALLDVFAGTRYDLAAVGFAGFERRRHLLVARRRRPRAAGKLRAPTGERDSSRRRKASESDSAISTGFVPIGSTRGSGSHGPT